MDRLINRADVVVIDGESLRLHEAVERQRVKATARKKDKDRPAAPADDRLNASAATAAPGDHDCRDFLTGEQRAELNDRLASSDPAKLVPAADVFARLRAG